MLDLVPKETFHYVMQLSLQLDWLYRGVNVWRKITISYKAHLRAVWLKCIIETMYSDS